MRNSRYVHHSSARAPFYMTSNKYGIYVETPADGHYAIAQAGKTSFSFREPQLKYDIIYGPGYADILNRYNAMAGPAFLPPLWAFGSIWWRDDAHEDLRDDANALKSTTGSKTSSVLMCDWASRATRLIVAMKTRCRAQ